MLSTCAANLVIKPDRFFNTSTVCVVREFDNFVLTCQMTRDSWVEGLERQMEETNKYSDGIQKKIETLESSMGEMILSIEMVKQKALVMEVLTALGTCTA